MIALWIILGVLALILVLLLLPAGIAVSYHNGTLTAEGRWLFLHFTLWPLPEKDKAEKERKEKEKREKETKEDENVDPKYAALEEKLNQLLKANEERSKAEAKKAVLNSVKSGLKDKFDNAKLEMNDFFLETALSKLEIPDEDADVQSLVSKAEKIYTADYKRATGSKAIPSKGSSETHNPQDQIDEHEFDDIVKRREKRFGKVGKDK